MKVRELVVRTLREVPSGAELPSHIFLLRGGYIQQVSSGLYSILPLGKRMIHKITRIIREEMDNVGGQEVELPLVQPSELWEESGRYNIIGDELLRFKDRAQHNMVLAMTHEEAVTHLMREMISSYKQLPCMVYQFQLKFRDEPRARGGLIRVREFTMKDGYSFHSSYEDLDQYYEKVHQAYLNIFHRVGIEPVVVQSDTGIMGGKVAHEFMLETKYGEDYLILAEDNSYSANQEIACFDRESVKEEPKPLERVATPAKKTIDEVSEFLGITAKQTMKSVCFRLKDVCVLVLLRGDLSVSDIKVRNSLKATELVPADEELMRDVGLVAGYAGPVGLESAKKLLILVDQSIADGNNFVSGANEDGWHIKNVCFGRDFTSKHVGDYAKAEGGHKSITGNSRLRAVRGVEIGNIFKLGEKFSKSMKANFLDEKGESKPMIMGCYGIGVGRLLASIAESRHDDFGPIWPKSIAPFQVIITSIGGDATVVDACNKLYQDLKKLGFEVLLDDRDERPGVKFKDADLWGIPVRLAISTKTLAEGLCEWKERDKSGFEKISIQDAVQKLKLFYQT